MKNDCEIYSRENVFTRIVIVAFLFFLWTYLYVVLDTKDIDPETMAKHTLGYYSTPIIIIYCIFEIWRTVAFPYKICINKDQKKLTQIYYLHKSKEISYSQLLEHETPKGTIFVLSLFDKSKVRVKGRFSRINNQED